jgi:FKBP-type peptidyl-prolyl cis-trans isomerase FklB
VSSTRAIRGCAGVAFSLALLLPAIASAQEGIAGPSGAAAQASYALGHQIGRDLLRQGRKLDADALREGLRDALAARPPAVDETEMSSLLVGLKRDVAGAQRAERLRRTAEHEAAGAEFLAARSREPGIVALASGVLYRVLREGSGARPGPRDEIVVHYRATLTDGNSFRDTRKKGEPETFHVSGVIPGLTEALQLMREGARWEVAIPPDLAYGRRGPLAGQTVVYDLELIRIVPADG